MGDLGDPTDWRPLAESASSRDDQERDRTRFLCWNWLLVYILNLPVCLYFGCMVTQNGGRPGMYAGILILFALGVWACRKSRQLGRALIRGGFVVAPTQFLPCVQVFVGSMGMILSAWVAALSGHPLSHAEEMPTFASGLIATLATGGSLMILALVIGLIVRRLIPDWSDDISVNSLEPMKPVRDVLHDFH